MKKFLIDTYRTFLLQTSKVIWEIVGCTLFTWFIFYTNPNSIWFVSTFGIFMGFWLVLRLYSPFGRYKLEEIESLRPANQYSKWIGNILVLLLFFMLAYGVTGFLYYDNRLIRFILWLNDYYKLGLDLSKSPYRNYVNIINHSNRSHSLIYQKEYLTNACYAYWCYIIPIAVAMRLKLVLRIILIIVVIIFMISSRSFIGFDNVFVKHDVIFYLIYLAMLIYLIIPKRINFK